MTFYSLLYVICFVHVGHGELITDVDEARRWLDEYNTRAEQEYYKVIQANWDYNTNITDHNQQKSVS